MKTLTSAVACAVFMSSAASAAGLGKLTVLSSLGQPLRAEIELTAVSGDEAGTLAVKLASTDAFRLANIEFNPALLSLRFSVEQQNGRQYIKVTSTQPVNDPFVDMLLELSWNNGRLVREYTFLLDPAELRLAQPAQVAAPVDVLPQRERPAAAQVAPSAPAKPAPAPRPAADAAPAASEYQVHKGDTLGKIARELKPTEVSLDMMLVALYRANPEAFIGNNMNRLRAGRILAVPDEAAVRATGNAEARGVVIAHAADFNAYRAKLAGQVAMAAPDKGVETGQSAAGKITAKVEELPTAANVSKDQLKLSKAAPGATGKTGSTAIEDKIAKDQKLADAAARVKELEKNVTDLEKLMEVKSKAAATAVPAPAELPAASVPAEEPVLKPAPKKKPKPIVKKAPEPGFVDMLMDNVAIVGGALGALLLALGLVAMKRRKKPAKPAVEPSILGLPTEQGQSLFAETGGASVDTNNSVFNSSFSPSASQLDTNEVDPVAEADVYIAYGRDAQAEEILKEALRTHPERHPVRLKLLEIYANRKDQRAFETQAGELYSLTKGQGDEWAQAAAMGLSIDPLNPLYQGAATAAPAPHQSELDQQALLSQQLDSAIASGDASSGLMDLDIGADEAPTAVPEPVAAAPAPAPAPAAKPLDDTLDFDLGGLTFEPISAAEPIPMSGPASTGPAAVPDLDFPATPAAAPAPAPAAAEETVDMAFDMDFDTPAAEVAKPADLKSLDDLSLDLGQDSGNDLAADFGTVDLSQEFKPAAADSKPAQPAAMFDLDAMDFDLPSTPAAPAAPAPAAAQAELSADDFLLPDLPSVPASTTDELSAEDFNIPAIQTPVLAPTPAPAAREFDLSGIDLDLPQGAGEDFASENLAATTAPGEMSAVHMEMETKLDLAIAYQEIGDKEGARELVDEVIKGGSAEQVAKANAMRANLA